jgi:hypothetical protein
MGQVRGVESGGDYSLTPEQNYDYPHSHASGAYQFEPGTWREWTEASGIGTQYDEAYKAPAGIQDAVAAFAMLHGKGVNDKSLWHNDKVTYPDITEVDTSPIALASATQPLSGATVGPGATVAPPTQGPWQGSTSPTVSYVPPARGAAADQDWRKNFQKGAFGSLGGAFGATGMPAIPSSLATNQQLQDYAKQLQGIATQKIQAQPLPEGAPVRPIALTPFTGARPMTYGAPSTIQDVMGGRTSYGQGGMSPQQSARYSLQPVDHDPWAGAGVPAGMV